MSTASHTVSQKTVIDHSDGPLMVIAGAGTGKTHTITERILSLIEKHSVSPESILALTFTEKAAQEMQTRVSSKLPLGSSEPFIGTFHAFADHILRSHGLEIGLNPEYTIVSDADLLLFLRQHIDRFTFNYYRTRSQPYALLLALAQFFGRLQDEAISPEAYLAHADELVATATTEEEIEAAGKHRECARAYTTYLELLIEKGKMDYAGLTYHATELLKNRPSVAAALAEQFRYIIVDEYQDTNIVQNTMVDLIAVHHRALMVVGDDDQAIYKWRGASLYNILSFKAAYPDAPQIVLNDNFRSTQPILDCSYAVIQKNNPARLEVQAGISKRLISRAFDPKKEYPIPEIHTFSNVSEEVEFVSQAAAREVKKKQTVAILGRTNALLKPYIDILARRNIPYETSTAITLIQKPVVKDMVSFLKVVLNPWDDLSLYRLLTMQALKIPMHELNELLQKTKSESTPLFTALNEELWNGIKKILHESIEHARMLSVGEVIGDFLQNSGYMEYIQANELAEETTDLAQFSEYIRAFEETHVHKTVADFLEYIQLSDDIGSVTHKNDNATDEPGIALLTVHGAKGLEFDVVYIVGCVQNKFPTINRSDTFEIPEKLVREALVEGAHLQEERRLFYVACTRARKKLFMTNSILYEGVKKFKPSIFCEEARVSGTAIAHDHTGAASTLDQLTFNFATGTEKDGASLGLRSTKKKISSLSFSQLSTYEICPEKYYFRYRLRLPEPPNPSLSFGVSLHNALRDFEMHLIEKSHTHTAADLYSEEDFAVLQNAFEKNWIGRGYDSRSLLEENKKIGWECLERFFQEEKARGIVPIFVEKSFSCLIDGVKISGRIDRIDLLPDGTYEIIDYKTGKSSSYNVKKDLQLSVYALAAQESLNLPVSRYTLHFLENGERISAGRSQTDIELARTTLQNAAVEIANSDFAATPGYQCRSCPYRMICPDAV